MNLFRTLFKFILFLVSLIPIVTFATNNLSLLNSPQYSVGFDVGGARPTNIGRAASFLSGYSTFSYSANTHNLNTSFFGISINKLFILSSLYTLQAGISAHYLSDMSVEGDLKQGISPPFYEAAYSYDVNSYQYLADAKLRRQICNDYFPYIYLGLGVASNSAYSYSTTVPSFLTVTPEYSNNTINSFTYSVGLGVDYFLLSKVSLGLGYRFINLGKVGLGSGTIRNVNVGDKLTQPNLYLNTLLFQLNYFI